MTLKLYKGKHFSAGEVSYIITSKNQMPTKETVWGNCCGTPRLCRMYAEKTNQKAEDVDGLVVFEAVNKGEYSGSRMPGYLHKRNRSSDL